MTVATTKEEDRRWRRLLAKIQFERRERSIPRIYRRLTDFERHDSICIVATVFFSLLESTPKEIFQHKSSLFLCIAPPPPHEYNLGEQTEFLILFSLQIIQSILQSLAGYDAAGDGIWKMGNEIVSIGGPDDSFYIDDEQVTPSPGLWSLITDKVPTNRYGYDDYRQYKELLYIVGLVTKPAISIFRKNEILASIERCGHILSYYNDI